MTDYEEKNRLCSLLGFSIEILALHAMVLEWSLHLEENNGQNYKLVLRKFDDESDLNRICINKNSGE
jgi:hypothetical protein